MGATDAADGDESKPRKQLGVLSLSLFLFSQASAGPCGIEETVGAGGIWPAVIGQVAILLLFSVPQAAISVALARRERGNGGFTLWAARHLGRTWGTAAGAWGLVAAGAYAAALGDNSVQYLAWVYPRVARRGESFLLVAAFTVASALVCTTSLRSANAVYGAITAFTVALFVALSALSAERLEYSAQPLLPPAGAADWGRFCGMLLYSAIFLDSAATCLRETADARTTVPVAMALVSVLVTGSNMAVLALTFFAAGAPAADWGDAYFAVVAERVGGPALRAAVVANGVASNFQIICSTIQNVSYMLAGMADARLAPAWLAPAPGAPPAAAAAATAALALAFGALGFQDSLAVQSVVYAGVVAVECAAFFAMRRGRGAAAWLAAVPAAAVVAGAVAQPRPVLLACVGGMLLLLAAARRWEPPRDGGDAKGARGDAEADDAHVLRAHRPERLPPGAGPLEI